MEYSENYLTALPGVFMEYILRTSRKKQNTSASVVIVPLSHVNTNSIAWNGWYRSNILSGMPNLTCGKYSTAGHGVFTILCLEARECRAHINSPYSGNGEGFSHRNKYLILLTEKKIDCRTQSILKNLPDCRT